MECISCMEEINTACSKTINFSHYFSFSVCIRHTHTHILLLRTCSLQSGSVKRVCSVARVDIIEFERLCGRRVQVQHWTSGLGFHSLPHFAFVLISSLLDFFSISFPLFFLYLSFSVSEAFIISGDFFCIVLSFDSFRIYVLLNLLMSCESCVSRRSVPDWTSSKGVWRPFCQEPKSPLTFKKYIHKIYKIHKQSRESPGIPSLWRPCNLCLSEGRTERCHTRTFKFRQFRECLAASCSL